MSDEVRRAKVVTEHDGQMPVPENPIVWVTECGECGKRLAVRASIPCEITVIGTSTYRLQCPKCGNQAVHTRPAPSSNLPANNYYTRDKFAWVLVLIPILTCFAEMYKGPAVFVIAFVANALLCQADEWQLKTLGLKGPNAWLGAFIVPVYLWSRGTVVGGIRIHFAIWIVSFMASLAVSFTEQNSTLEAAAKPVVTQIIRDQVPNGATCVRVHVTEKVNYGYYRAIATLSNGSDLRIMIEDRGKTIYVTVTP